MFTLTIQDQNDQIVTQASFEQGSYVIGRLETCDIVLPSSSVSRQHARIFVQNGRCYIEDMGSANGVIVDGQRVVGKRDLGTASQIHIGDFYIFLSHQRPGLNDEQRVLQTVFIPRGSDHHKLVRIFDAFAGEEFVLSEIENTIGRTDENFILLSDASISRNHALIRRDGDHYYVSDLGSSNGTKLNNKPIKAPTRLNDNDQVKFGNVCFIFVPSDAQVDVRSLTPPPSQGPNITQIGVVAVLIILSLSVGGAIVFFMSQKKKQQDALTAQPEVTAPAVEPVSVRIEQLQTQGQKAMERQDWDAAKAAFEELLRVQPEHPTAKSELNKAQAEKGASEELERAELLIEQGKHQDAKLILLEIPKETRAAERATSNLDHINRTLSYNLKNEALRLIKSGKKPELSQAHQKLVEALGITPENKELLEQVQELEATLSKKRIKFTAYAPAEP